MLPVAGIDVSTVCSVAVIALMILLLSAQLLVALPPSPSSRGVRWSVYFHCEQGFQERFAYPADDGAIGVCNQKWGRTGCLGACSPRRI